MIQYCPLQTFQHWHPFLIPLILRQCIGNRRMTNRCFNPINEIYFALTLFVDDTESHPSWECVVILLIEVKATLIARFMGLTWGPPGADRTQVGPCWPHELSYLGAVHSWYLVVSLLPWTQKKTPHSSPIRARYGVFSVSSGSEQSLCFLPFVWCSISRYIRPRYIGSLQYLQ